MVSPVQQLYFSYVYTGFVMPVYTSTNRVYRTITLSRLPLMVCDADRKVSAQPVADMSLLCLYAMSYYVIKTQDSGKPSLSSQIIYPLHTPAQLYGRCLVDMFKREIVSNLDFLRAAWKDDSIKVLSEVMMLGANDTVMQELAILKTVLCWYTER